MITKENLRVRKVDVQVKDLIITYDEYYLVDENGQEIFDRKLEIENDGRLYEMYKKRKELLTKEEIKHIREKYGLTQKEYASVIGVGEITIHRFENGSIQTDAIDSIMKLSINPENMDFLLLQNKKNISKELYNKMTKTLKELKELKKHQIINISSIKSKKDEFEEANALDVAKNIIKTYNDGIDELISKYDIESQYITNLKLQKLLYYVQAFSLLVYGKKAFSEKIIAWSYGPVVKEVYSKYKNQGKAELKTEANVEKLSEGLNKIIKSVIDGYGNMEATKLIDFTHNEDPWKKTKVNEEIKRENILEYFVRVYDL